MKINKTNAARILDHLAIPYELIPYTVDEEDLGAKHIADLNSQFSILNSQFRLCRPRQCRDRLEEGRPLFPRQKM